MMAPGHTRSLFHGVFCRVQKRLCSGAAVFLSVPQSFSFLFFCLPVLLPIPLSFFIPLCSFLSLSLHLADSLFLFPAPHPDFYFFHILSSCASLSCSFPFLISCLLCSSFCPYFFFSLSLSTYYLLVYLHLALCHCLSLAPSLHCYSITLILSVPVSCCLSFFCLLNPIFWLPVPHWFSTSF